MEKKIKLSAIIDHTLLKAAATKEQIIKLCKEAKQYSFASVCVNPANVKLAAKELCGSSVKVCTVIGFPLGANTSLVKAFEATDAIANGASEVDMVINIGALKAGDKELVYSDIKAVREASKGQVLKVIIETCYLTDAEKQIACELAKKAGADFVKTSTGFGTAGAKTEDIKLMRSIVGNALGVKASGGIRDISAAMAMVEAGANRLGCSAGIAIAEAEE